MSIAIIGLIAAVAMPAKLGDSSPAKAAKPTEAK